MPNLEYLNLKKCRSLKEVHHSLRCSSKLIELDLHECESLERFPYVNVLSLKSLNLVSCSSLEKLPEILGIMKPELEIKMKYSGIREIPPFIIHLQAHLTELDLSGMNNLLSLPSSICKLKDLVKLNVSGCSKLERLPEGIGDLEKLEELNLSSCNLMDGGLLEDIGSLSCLKFLYLSGNNFEYLPRSIAQLGALRTLHLSNCKRLKELPEIFQQLDTINADWSNDWICYSLFQNISSLQHDISVSDSLSLRVFTSWWWHIPSWFHHRVMDTSVLVNLRENWYVSDNFLGFAVCYSGILIDDIITAHLIPLCDDGMSSMTQKFALSKHSEDIDEYGIHFLLVPLAGLWDASKANGKTPNDYRCFGLYSPGEIHEFGVRLLYKNELHIGTRRSRYEDGSCSSSKKQRSQFPKRLGL